MRPAKALPPSGYVPTSADTLDSFRDRMARYARDVERAARERRRQAEERDAANDADEVPA